MSTVKVSVTLDEGLVVETKSRVGERGLSRFLNETLEQRLQRLRIMEMIRQFEEEDGPIPDDVWAEAEAEARTWPL